MFKRELQLRRERLDPSTEFAFSERREFVEKRLDYCWVEDDHRKLEDKPGIGEREDKIIRSWGKSQEHHDPRNEAVAGPFKDIEKGRKEGRANY